MKKFSAPLVFSLLLGTTISTYASTWNFVWVGNDEARYFFDADTVEKSREITTLWVKIVRVSQSDKKISSAVASRWRMNCSKRTIQTLTSSEYDKDGQFIRSYPNPGKEEEVIPDSTGEAMLKIGCTADFPKNKSGKDYFKLDHNDVFQATRNYVELIKSQQDNAPQ